MASLRIVFLLVLLARNLSAAGPAGSGQLGELLHDAQSTTGRSSAETVRLFGVNISAQRGAAGSTTQPTHVGGDREAATLDEHLATFVATKKPAQPLGSAASAARDPPAALFAAPPTDVSIARSGKYNRQQATGTDRRGEWLLSKDPRIQDLVRIGQKVRDRQKRASDVDGVPEHFSVPKRARGEASRSGEVKRLDRLYRAARMRASRTPEADGPTAARRHAEVAALHAQLIAESKRQQDHRLGWNYIEALEGFVGRQRSHVEQLRGDPSAKKEAADWTDGIEAELEAARTKHQNIYGPRGLQTAGRPDADTLPREVQPFSSGPSSSQKRTRLTQS